MVLILRRPKTFVDKKLLAQFIERLQLTSTHMLNLKQMTPFTIVINVIQCNMKGKNKYACINNKWIHL